MHGELAAILAAAAAAGIEVMPLKGALLTTMAGRGPRRRPMADLDLLVHPADRAGLGAVLAGLGYRHAPEANPRPTHDVFLDPGGGRVVSFEGEHPDNPRRVEVHVEVKRHLWGWVDDDDLTAALWAGARSGEVLGQRAAIPRPDALFAHLAIHASSDLLSGRGRLVQWLDLGSMAPLAGDLATMPHPRLAFPALRLAARALPDAMAALDLAPLSGARPAPPRSLGRDRAARSPLRADDRPAADRAVRSRRAMGALATRPMASRGRLRGRAAPGRIGAPRADRHRPDEGPRRRLTSVA